MCSDYYNWLFFGPYLSYRIRYKSQLTAILLSGQIIPYGGPTLVSSDLEYFPHFTLPSNSYLWSCYISIYARLFSTKTAILPFIIHWLPFWSAGWLVRVWCGFAEWELTLLKTEFTREHKQPNQSRQRWNSSVLVLRGKITVFVKGVWRLRREPIMASTPHRKGPVWGKGKVVKKF